MHPCTDLLKEKMCQTRKGLSTNLILTSQIHLAWPSATERSGSWRCRNLEKKLFSLILILTSDLHSPGLLLQLFHSDVHYLKISVSRTSSIPYSLMFKSCILLTFHFSLRIWQKRDIVPSSTQEPCSQIHIFRNIHARKRNLAGYFFMLLNCTCWLCLNVVLQVWLLCRPLGKWKRYLTLSYRLEQRLQELFSKGKLTEFVKSC